MELCDVCGASSIKAYWVAVSTMSSNKLTFCSHHKNELEEKLVNDGFTIKELT